MNPLTRITHALAVGALALLSLAGCDDRRIRELEEDLSTEANVRARFGEPARIWPEQDGSQTLEYNRQPAGHRNYMITIGPGGKMTALRQVLAPHNFKKVQPGMDELAVRRLLGMPARTHDVRVEAGDGLGLELDRPAQPRDDFHRDFRPRWPRQAVGQRGEAARRALSIFMLSRRFLTWGWARRVPRCP